MIDFSEPPKLWIPERPAIIQPGIDLSKYFPVELDQYSCSAFISEMIDNGRIDTAAIPFGMFKGLSGGKTIADIITRLSGKTYAIYDFRPGSNSIFSDTAATTPITGTGTAVAAVKDLGNMARNLTQSTLANRPLSASNGSTFDGTNDVLNTTASSFAVGTVFTALNMSSTTADYSGVVTNQSDQATNVDFAFTKNGSTATWDSGQSAGNGLGNSSRFWRNTIQTTNITLDAMTVYSVDGTSFPSTLNFPNGLRVGSDRSNGSRNLKGTIGLIVSVTTVLSEADRQYIESTIMNIFSL